jgi:hypothetical protein
VKGTASHFAFNILKMQEKENGCKSRKMASNGMAFKRSGVQFSSAPPKK